MLANLGLSWGTPFVLFAIYGLVRYFAKPNDKQSQVNWTPLESVGVVLFIYFVGQILGALSIYIFPLLAGVSQESVTNWLSNNVYGQFLLVTVVELLMFAILYRFIKRRGASLRTIGLKKPKLIDIGYVLLGFGIYFITYLFVQSVLKNVLPQVDQNQKQVIGFDGAHGWQLLLVFVSLVILPPVVEEIMMRGFLYSGLKKGLKIVWAAIITSSLFAIAHLQAGSGQPLLWSAAIDTFILSFVLIYLREKTGSLWASIGLHMLKNGVAFVSIFVFHLV